MSTSTIIFLEDMIEHFAITAKSKDINTTYEQIADFIDDNDLHGIDKDTFHMEFKDHFENFCEHIKNAKNIKI